LRTGFVWKDNSKGGARSANAAATLMCYWFEFVARAIGNSPSPG